MSSCLSQGASRTVQEFVLWHLCRDSDQLIFGLVALPFEGCFVFWGQACYLLFVWFCCFWFAWLISLLWPASECALASSSPTAGACLHLVLTNKSHQGTFFKVLKSRIAVLGVHLQLLWKEGRPYFLETAWFPQSMLILTKPVIYDCAGSADEEFFFLWELGSVGCSELTSPSLLCPHASVQLLNDKGDGLRCRRSSAGNWTWLKALENWAPTFQQRDGMSGIWHSSFPFENCTLHAIIFHCTSGRMGERCFPRLVVLAPNKVVIPASLNFNVLCQN